MKPSPTYQPKFAAPLDGETQRARLHQEIKRLRYKSQILLKNWKAVSAEKKLTKYQINQIQEAIKFAEFEVSKLEAQQDRLAQRESSIRKEIAILEPKHPSDSLTTEAIRNSIHVQGLIEELPQIARAVESKYHSIDKYKRRLVILELDLKEESNWLQNLNDDFKELDTHYRQAIEKIERLKQQLHRPVRTYTHPMQSTPTSPTRINKNKSSNLDEIGAGDLQEMIFETFTLSGELGAFLGHLDRNKTCFALTGDSGAGKSHFSFEIANLFITDQGFRVKYFSLEEGVGRLTQEKVAKYSFGNELSLAAKGTIEDVRAAAKEYPMVIVDSFNSLGAKAEEFERLRMDFPQTIFLLIFQKTTAGTIRGGSAIKYNSSATIDVVRRDGERVAIMEKGRYGTIGWEYSISERRIINSV